MDMYIFGIECLVDRIKANKIACNYCIVLTQIKYIFNDYHEHKISTSMEKSNVSVNLRDCFDGILLGMWAGC